MGLEQKKIKAKKKQNKKHTVKANQVFFLFLSFYPLFFVQWKPTELFYLDIN